MNIRSHFKWSKPYHLINREERNICAILYHLIQTNNNIYKFAELLDVNKDELNEYSIFFEYSYLRDIWHEIKDDHAKQSYIVTALGYPEHHWLSKCSFIEFNKYFGAAPKPSEKHIQSPSNWAISNFDKNIKDNAEFLAASRFKWCFNAKPDIVLHYGKDKAICIEAKLESGVGVYPGTEKDKDVFRQRGLESEKQTDTQIEIFKLLGISAKFFILSLKKAGSGRIHKPITWHE